MCDFIELKDDRLNHECKECKKRWLMSINGLIEKFSNVYQLCNGDTNKFILLLRKGVYPYEYMDSQEDLMKHHYQIKKAFYSELCLEDITDKD